MIVTIDGPVGGGKSTIAQLIAQEKNFFFLSSGFIYRIFGYIIFKKKISFDNENELLLILKEYNFCYYNSIEKKPIIIFQNDDITHELKREEIGTIASTISSYKNIRVFAAEYQRRLCQEGNSIVEGRDCGTVIFPFAEVKIYLTADKSIRTKRVVERIHSFSIDELKDNTLKSIEEKVIKRDQLDSQRVHSPLMPAYDSFIIDTTFLTRQEVKNLIENIILYKK